MDVAWVLAWVAYSSLYILDNTLLANEKTFAAAEMRKIYMKIKIKKIADAINPAIICPKVLKVPDELQKSVWQMQ